MKSFAAFFRWRTILLLAFAVLAVSVGCKKEEDLVPNEYVDVTISLNDPSFNDLNPVGGWVYITGGVRGIIVYHKGNDEFIALERNCTYQPSDDCARVAVDSTNIYAADACCGSSFQLSDGSVVKGPASRPLKSYSTYYDKSNNSLHIYNY